VIARQNKDVKKEKEKKNQRWKILLFLCISLTLKSDKNTKGRRLTEISHTDNRFQSLPAMPGANPKITAFT
jgi:hypothetical protein